MERKREKDAKKFSDFYLILPTALWEKYYYSHFINEEIELQRGQ